MSVLSPLLTTLSGQLGHSKLSCGSLVTLRRLSQVSLIEYILFTTK
jgi:hypothetical protein